MFDQYFLTVSLRKEVETMAEAKANIATIQELLVTHPEITMTASIGSQLDAAPPPP